MRKRKIAKKQQSHARSAKRVWNHIVAKLSSKSILEVAEPTIDELAGVTIFTQQDEDERYERHMIPIREAQKHNDY